MSLLLATIRGDLRAAMEAEIRDVARAMRRGVERAGREPGTEWVILIEPLFLG